MNQHELAGTSMHQIGGWRFDFESPTSLKNDAF
jgi:hypothetical protein